MTILDKTTHRFQKHRFTAKGCAWLAAVGKGAMIFGLGVLWCALLMGPLSDAAEVMPALEV